MDEHEMSKSTNAANVNEPSFTTNRKHHFRLKKRWIVYLILLIGLVPYFCFRMASFGNKLRVLENAATSITQGDSVGPNHLCVATWNLAHGRGATDDNWAEGAQEKEFRIALIAEQITEWNADLVVLNEVDFSATWSGGYDQAKAIAEKAGYHYYLTQSNLDFGFAYGRWNFGNVLLSRYPIEDARVVSLTGVNAWEDWVVGAKRGFSCTVLVTDERRISVVGLHLESRGETTRVQQATDVIETCRGLAFPVLLAGDLNTTPRNAPHSQADEQGKNAFEEVIRETGMSYSPLAKPNSNELTFPSDAPRSTIDWILFNSDAFELVDQTVVQSLLSDHLPVVAEFSIKTRDTMGQRIGVARRTGKQE